MDAAAKIPLWHKGEIVSSTLVDAADYDQLSEHVWYLSNGYAVRWLKERSSKVKSGWRTGVVGMHRELLGIIGDRGLWGDHIFGDKLDNRREKLRAVTPKENRYNSVPHSKTGVKGVNLHPNGKYTAKFDLGMFDTLEEAAAAVEECRKWAGRPEVIR